VNPKRRAEISMTRGPGLAAAWAWNQMGTAATLANSRYISGNFAGFIEPFLSLAQLFYCTMTLAVIFGWTEQ
jgi:hypothetical protein